MTPHVTAVPHIAAADTFDQMARVCERIAASPGRNEKLGLLAAFLRSLDSADQLRALRFLSGQPVETEDGRKLALGHATLRDALVAASGWDIDTVRLCYRETGDTGESISHLMNGLTRCEPLSLGAGEQRFLRVYQARKTEARVEILRECFLTLHPLTLRYFVKVITGSFRIGLEERLLEQAFAQAAGVTPQAIREACNKTGDLARVAAAVQRGELRDVAVRLFHPMEFMLAQPIEQAGGITNPMDWLVEDKFDGIRSQIHVDGDEVRIFTRGREDATASFPDIVALVAGQPKRLVIDGEILAWRDGRALPFALLQQRIARKRVSEKVRREVPVTLIAYDLLFHGDELLLDQPIERRRELLAATGLATSRQQDLENLDAMFLSARERGNEGLLLKRRGSKYEAGKRSDAWLKVKRPFGTLDVVITAAEQGHGRRATLLSDYTFAVRSGDRFLNIGKAYSGLTDDEIRELTKQLRALTTDRFGGRVFLVKPEIVLEVAFDGIMRSSRHKSGYSLRFPRIVRLRPDKSATEADTLEAVEAMFARSLA